MSDVAVLPACAFRDVLTAGDPSADWRRIILDTRWMLEPGYEPPDLVDTAAAGLNGGYRVRAVVVADLTAMARAAAEADAALAITSAYRSYADQRATFRHWVRTAGKAQALRTSARPGHSEHQLGTTIDFRSAGDSRPAWQYRDWGRTAAGAWLSTNSWRFGFVISYPRGEAARTCYRYEPWHVRYVGRHVAAAIQRSGLAPREWLWLESAPEKRQTNG